GNSLSSHEDSVMVFAGQHAIAAEVGFKPGAPQALLHLTRYVAAARELVRRSGVVEEQAARAEYPRELIVEGLRIQLSRDAEARRIVQDRRDRAGRQRLDAR